MNCGERAPLKVLICCFRPRELPVWSAVALEYSNITDCERLSQTATDSVTCPNDRERPRRREFASRWSL